MTLLASLGLNSSDLTEQGLSKLILATNSQAADPDDYLSAAGEIGGLEEALDVIYLGATKKAELEDEQVDRYYLERAKEYLDLHQQLDSSAKLLSSLSVFLSTFQTDLSSVSSSIASLQGRSKLIESRLESRRQTEAVLSPYLASIVIPPSVAQILLHTSPSEDWIPAIDTFERKLTALRSLPRNPHRTSLEVAAEALRLSAAYKIRDLFLSILQPFRTSISHNLQITQSSVLRRYRALFAFLQRHAARVAHEVQKAYVGTARWYLETGFRRYVRALDKVRTRGPPVEKADGQGSDGFALNARADGGGVILAYLADDPTLRHSPEHLFRSMSVVFADNALSEHMFVSNFFGVPDGELSRSIGAGSVVGWDEKPADRPSAPSTVDGDSVITSPGDPSTGERRRKTAVDVVWKAVVEPMMEYHTTFTANVLSTSPSTISLYTMIRLIDALLIKAASCPPLETHLMSIKMQLWPPFQASFKATISHLTKMASGTVAGSGSFFGTGRSTVKEGAIFDAAKEYSGLFNAMIAVAPADVAEDESDSGGLVTFGASLAANESMKVFGDLRQVRETLVGVVKAQAGRATSAEGARTFQVKAYQSVLHDLMVAGRASVPRCQAEIAHWRELLRKVA